MEESRNPDAVARDLNLLLAAAPILMTWMSLRMAKTGLASFMMGTLGMAMRWPIPNVSFF